MVGRSRSLAVKLLFGARPKLADEEPPFHAASPLYPVGLIDSSRSDRGTRVFGGKGKTQC
jgi:hypothetical protein